MHQAYVSKTVKHTPCDSTTVSGSHSLFPSRLGKWKKVRVLTTRFKAAGSAARHLIQTDEGESHESYSGLHRTKKLHKVKGISFGGAGIFFWWEIGCVLWLLENVDIANCPIHGASGGALAATLAACRVDPFHAFDVANTLANEKKVFSRTLGVAGIWGALIREWLDEILPDNAAEICTDKVSLVVTLVPDLKLKALSKFESKKMLIEANLASCHIPFFLDGNCSANYKGMKCIDGSFLDFFTGKNSDLLTRNGRSLDFDYFHDKRLDRKRLGFLALKKPAEVIKMIYLGHDYTERLSKTQIFTNALLKNQCSSNNGKSHEARYQEMQNSSIAFTI